MSNNDHNGIGSQSLSTPFLSIVPQLRDNRQKEQLEKLKRKEKFGTRKLVPRMPYDRWRKDHDSQHHSNLIMMAAEHVVLNEMLVLLYLVNNQPGKRKLSKSEIARGLRKDRVNTLKIINRLVSSGFIVNIGHSASLNLALNPLEGHWDFRMLCRLRNAENVRKNGV